jgi:putative ABC transport system permease protein
MDFGPILSSLRRSPTGAILVALQIALALAITVNSLYIVQQRLERIGRDPGLDVANTFLVSFAPVGRSFNADVVMREDVQLLRSLPGCRCGDDRSTRCRCLAADLPAIYFTQPGEKGVRAPVNYFEVDEQGLDTLGVKLVEGRNFDASVVTKPAPNTRRRLRPR